MGISQIPSTCTINGFLMHVPDDSNFVYLELCWLSMFICLVLLYNIIDVMSRRALSLTPKCGKEIPPLAFMWELDLVVSGLAMLHAHLWFHWTFHPSSPIYLPKIFPSKNPTSSSIQVSGTLSFGAEAIFGSVQLSICYYKSCLTLWALCILLRWT